MHGHERPRSPFASVGPAVGVALAYGLIALLWIAIGDRLPGGRWLAVHLFTLGVLSNVVLAFSQHFGRTVTRAPGAGERQQTGERGIKGAGERQRAGERWWWRPAVLNVAVALVLIGIPTSNAWATAVGATAATTVVLDGYRRLRRMRKQAVGARFGWIARVYERAHGSFVHGATLGLLLGVGVLSGPWYATGRLAHLHVNILGWGGLTLLATLVFFGPTVVRARIEDGADARAAIALRRGATGLTAAALLLLASGPSLATTGSRIARLGWGLVAVTVVAQVMIGLWPAGSARSRRA